MLNWCVTKTLTTSSLIYTGIASDLSNFENFVLETNLEDGIGLEFKVTDVSGNLGSSLTTIAIGLSTVNIDVQSLAGLIDLTQVTAVSFKYEDIDPFGGNGSFNSIGYTILNDGQTSGVPIASTITLMAVGGVIIAAIETSATVAAGATAIVSAPIVIAAVVIGGISYYILGSD